MGIFLVIDEIGLILQVLTGMVNQAPVTQFS